MGAVESSLRSSQVAGADLVPVRSSLACASSATTPPTVDGGDEASAADTADGPHLACRGRGVEAYRIELTSASAPRVGLAGVWGMPIMDRWGGNA